MLKGKWFERYKVIQFDILYVFEIRFRFIQGYFRFSSKGYNWNMNEFFLRNKMVNVFFSFVFLE